MFTINPLDLYPLGLRFCKVLATEAARGESEIMLYSKELILGIDVKK